MKKWKILVIICLTAMCMMSGCQPVPENVKQDIAAMEKAKAEMKEIKENSEYQKVSKISKLAGRRMKEERNLLHIDAEVYVPDALEVYQFQCKNNKAFWLNRYQILEDVSGVKITEDSPYLWGYEQLENYFRGKEQQFYFTNPQEPTEKGQAGKFGRFGEKYLEVEESGWFSIVDGRVPSFYDVGNNESMTECYRGQELLQHSQTYKLLDGTAVSMEDVRGIFAENVRYFEEYLPGTTIELQEMRVMQAEEEKCYLVLNGIVRYKGMPWDNLPENREDDFLHSFNTIGCEFQQLLTSAKGPELIMMKESYEEISITRTYDELLSLDSALDILAAKVAMNKVTDISRVSLEYLLYYPKEEKGTNNPKIVFEGRPVWCFVEELGDFDMEGRLPTEKVGNIFYIDAVTGEFFAYEKRSY